MSVLTACATVPTLSNDQRDKIANYSTALLLKYDANYKSRLINTAAIEEQRAIIEEEEKKKQEEIKKEEEIREETTQNDQVLEEIEEDIYVDLASLLEVQGASIEYAYIEVVDKYPKEETTTFAPVMQSTEGYNLLVVHFTLTNLLENSNEVSIYNMNATFKFDINKTTRKEALTTLLLNDFAFYSAVLEPGKMEDLVLIVEIKEVESSDIQSLSMIINISEDSIRTK